MKVTRHQSIFISFIPCSCRKDDPKFRPIRFPVDGMQYCIPPGGRTGLIEILVSPLTFLNFSREKTTGGRGKSDSLFQHVLPHVPQRSRRA